MLAADPWLDGDACFGSWGLTHQAPPERVEAVLACPFVWLSQDREDHAHLPTLERLSGSTILLPDHRGGRLRRRLQDRGHRVEVLPDGAWRRLSPRIRVQCLTDVTQDAALLVEMGGRLLVDANDAREHGAAMHIHREVCRLGTAWLLCGVGEGPLPADLRLPGGRRIRPRMLQAGEVGGHIQSLVDYMSATYFVPLGPGYRYQRRDSLWANELLPGPHAHYTGFNAPRAEVLPPFVSWDFERRCPAPLRVEPRPPCIRDPADSGDDPAEPLTGEEVRELCSHVASLEVLSHHLDFLGFRTGGREHRVPLGAAAGRGLVLEAPRGSLLRALREDRFEELLVGNICSLELHGAWPDPPAPRMLFARLAFFLGRLAPAGVRRDQDLRAYLEDYRDRGIHEAGAAGFDGEVREVLDPWLGR